MSRLKSTIFLVLLLAAPMDGRPVEPISEDLMGLPVEEIRFEGNKDVENAKICEVLQFIQGEGFSRESLEASRQAILELGPFKRSESRVERGKIGVIVTFEVVEKWHVMSVPGFGKKDDDYVCRPRPPEPDFQSFEGQVIEEIRFQGNKVTREVILREELFFQEGDPFSREQMVKSQQSIQNLGLYKKVVSQVERGTTGVIVTFIVEEKWYFLPIPRLGRNADGDISYGGELRWDNALGLNQQIKLVAEQEDQADGETQQRTSLEYRIPKIPRTPYGVSSKLERKRTLTDSVDDDGEPLGQYYAHQDSFSVALSRWLKRTAPSQGWRGSIGMRINRDHNEQVRGDPILLEDHRQIDLGASGGFTAVNDHEFYRSGEEYGAGVGFGREALGSSENYYNIGIDWRRYNPIHVPIWSNVNLQFRTGYNQGQTNHFSLGGSGSMRGILEQDKLEGDVFALINVNWLIPQPKYPAFRWNIFTDIGNAWPRNDVNLLRWEKTLGVGARWKIRSLVNTTLRLDVGYNPATGEYKVYAGTNNMF